MTDDVFAGRQPICKEKAEVVGYELLWQQNGLAEAAFKDQDRAVAADLVKSAIDTGLDKLAGQDLAFVKITRDFLLSDFCSSLPRERVVLEIPSDTTVDRPLVHSIAKLSNNGYAIALDNFVGGDQIRPIAEFVDIAKIDIQEGLTGEAKCIVSAKDETYEDMEWGRINPQMAVMFGKVKVSDLGEILDFIPLFHRCEEFYK